MLTQEPGSEALCRVSAFLWKEANASISSGSVKLSVFLRALSLMGYTLEIQKGKSVISIRPENYALAERKDHNE